MSAEPLIAKTYVKRLSIRVQMCVVDDDDGGGGGSISTSMLASSLSLKPAKLRYGK